MSDFETVVLIESCRAVIKDMVLMADEQLKNDPIEQIKRMLHKLVETITSVFN